jgi:hypothetical protein
MNNQAKRYTKNNFRQANEMLEEFQNIIRVRIMIGADDREAQMSIDEIDQALCTYTRHLSIHN